MKKRAQEEIVGFALIMIIVAVILLIFLGIYLGSSKEETLESYEVESFMQSIRQYTSDCQDYHGPLDVEDLLGDCKIQNFCLDGRSTCNVLNSTLKEILKKSWKIKGDRPLKGYSLIIIAEDSNLIVIQEGNLTNNYKGSAQYLPKQIDMYFKVYY